MTATYRARAWSLLAAAVTLGAAAACSGDDGGGDDGAGAEPDPAGATASDDSSTDAAAEVEAYDGPVEGFYEVPDPLPAGEPGDVIRTMPIEAPAGEVGLRIMYHSTDAEGDDRAVTGVVYHPAGEVEAPEGGWPVIAWAHGTTGLAPVCAPSRAPMEPPGYGVEGVRVATDYIGLGPDGELHPYLSAAAEGHAVVDSVAAVRALPDAHAGDRWVLAGHSQGGHAVLVASEVAAERLPDAELVGAVAIAPGAQLSRTYGDDVTARIITTMVLFGAAQEDPAIDPSTYLRPEVHDAAAEAIETGCVNDVTNALLPFATSDDYFTVDPREESLGSAWLEDNDPGQVVFEAPLLVVQGGQDPIVVPARTTDLLTRLCDLGQQVEHLDYPDADHGTVIPQSNPDIEAWLAARLTNDDPAPSTC